MSASCLNTARLDRIIRLLPYKVQDFTERDRSGAHIEARSVDVLLACSEVKPSELFVKRLFPNYLQEIMWRRVDPVHSFLPLVFIATFWCVVYAQSDTNGPSNTCPTECIARQYWWTSMWGFIVTLVALTMDCWGLAKAYDESMILHIIITFPISALNPLFVLWKMLQNTMDGRVMLANLRKALGDDVVAPMYPWRKSHIKIISGCKVIVNLSPNVYRVIHKLNAFDDEINVENLSEALVIGTKVENTKQFNVQLSRKGQLALLRSNVLPPYDELKFLRGNSTLGMAIASAQAIGYIYGIVVRCVQGLRVTPIEGIACVLNMVVLMKGVLHIFSSLGHRPLLLYLLPEDEANFVEECKNIQSIDLNIGGRFNLGLSIACGAALGVGAYFVVNFRKSLNRNCLVPIILFEVGLVLGGIQGFSRVKGNSFSLYMCLVILTVLLNLAGYVWALVVTFKYWKGEEFDVQSSNYLSQVLPYIGQF